LDTAGGAGFNGHAYACHHPRDPKIDKSLRSHEPRVELALRIDELFALRAKQKVVNGRGLVHLHFVLR